MWKETSYRHIRSPSTLEDCHGRQRARSHSGIFLFLCGTMRINAVQLWSIKIEATQYERGANVALITEQHLLYHRVGGAHRHNTASVKTMQFQLAGYHLGSHLCISCCASSTTAENNFNHLTTVGDISTVINKVTAMLTTCWEQDNESWGYTYQLQWYLQSLVYHHQE